jgi:hypothetical protein
MVDAPRPGFAKFALCTLCASALFALCVPSAQASTQEFGTSLGMNLQQVQSQFPNAVAPADHARLANGASDDLHLANTEIAHAPFTADFYFKNGTLVAIILSNPDIRTLATNAANALFEKMHAEFTQAYGIPVGCQMARNFSLLQSCQWSSQSANITLVNFALRNQPLLLEAILEKKD